jgi:tetratricopeptide (TPR) repeat protein
LTTEAVSRLLAGAAIAAVLMVICSGRDAAGVWQPFVWVDLAVIHLLAAWPLAQRLRARVPGTTRGAVLLVAAATMIAVVFSLRDVPPGSFAVGVLVRSGIALTIAWIAGEAASWLLPACEPADPSASQSSSHPYASLITAAAAMLCLCLPAAFGFDRSNTEFKHLADVLPQQRPAEAARIAECLLAVRPDAGFQGAPLRSTSLDLREYLKELRAELAQGEFHGTAGALRKSDLFMQCGAWDDAMRAARAALSEPGGEVPASLALAVLAAERKDWSASLAWHTRARDAADDRDMNAWVAATNGIGVAHRHLGQFQAAEAACLAVIERLPTADAHYRLAQLYEATNRGPDAMTHVVEAARLDPDYTSRLDMLRARQASHGFCSPGGAR